jgi:predicted permease
MARLRPGVRPEHFGAVIDAAFKGISGKYLGEPAAAVLNGRQGIDENRGDYGRVLMPLLGTVGVMLLIACANLAGMLLARGSARRHELSIRGALGAGRGRLVRQLMAECLLLTLVGGALGTLAAGWGGMLLGRVLAGSTSAFKYDARMDWRVLGFALALVVVTALVSGIYPALKAGSAKSAGPGPMRGGSRSRAGGTLVVAQICLSLILVVVAGLYARTLSNLLGVSPGFSVENLLIFHANPGNLRMTDAEVRTYYSSVQDALRPMPGVTSASLMPYPFLSNTSQVDDVAVPGREKDGGAAHEANSMDVGDSFFETLGIRILAGRGIIVSDTANAPKVAVVNSAFVRQFFGGEAPIGRVIRVRGSDWRVVGVCADTRFSRLWQPSHPTMYFPFRQQTPGSAFFAVRTALPPASIAAQVRRAVDRINPAIAVDDVSTQRELLDATIGPQRIVAALCGSLAALTLALSCAGLYGLISHDVARRTGEIGVRMALGASKAQILGPVLRWALAIGGLGIAAGLPLSYAVARVYCTNLFGLTTGDPATYAGSGALMMAVTLLAAAVPARRASCVDPLAALRCE